MQVFEGYGIRFEYPGDWEVTRNQDDDEHITVTAEASRTAFWMVSIMRDRPPVDAVIDSVLESFRSEYDEVDVYESEATICLLPTASLDIDFVCMELINRASIRVCETDDCTIFVLQQNSDTETAEIKSQLKAVTKSLMWEAADDPVADPFEFDNLFGSEPNANGE